MPALEGESESEREEWGSGGEGKGLFLCPRAQCLGSERAARGPAIIVNCLVPKSYRYQYHPRISLSPL